MSLQLRPKLYWCDCGGRAVFLDTLADRYFCLSQLANDSFLRLAAGQARPGDAARLRNLVEQKILIETDGPALIRSPAQIESPTHDLIDCLGSLAPPLAIVRALLFEFRTARSLRTRPFHQVLDEARDDPVRAKPHSFRPVRSLEEIALAADVLSFITRSHDRCLVRALAVHAMCKRSGANTNLVFGVIAHPFTAHCWVQTGSAVLVGGCEHARLYTPVLVI